MDTPTATPFAKTGNSRFKEKKERVQSTTCFENSPNLKAAMAAIRRAGPVVKSKCEYVQAIRFGKHIGSVATEKALPRTIYSVSSKAKDSSGARTNRLRPTTANHSTPAANQMAAPQTAGR
jgi:hypothetical protein